MHYVPSSKSTVTPLPELICVPKPSVHLLNNVLMYLLVHNAQRLLYNRKICGWKQFLATILISNLVLTTKLIVYSQTTCFQNIINRPIARDVTFWPLPYTSVWPPPCWRSQMYCGRKALNVSLFTKASDYSNKERSLCACILQIL